MGHDKEKGGEGIGGTEAPVEEKLTVASHEELYRFMRDHPDTAKAVAEALFTPYIRDP